MNKILAFILIIIILPVWCVVALIQLVIFRRVVFRQKRTGKGLKEFTLFKFQTMFSSSNEIPPWGKLLRRTSLDETPQLINVVLGDMNFVGPRPLLPEYAHLYTEEQNRRHDVKPGITGWAQVRGRTSITWEKQFEYDVWYVENKSMIMNLKILWLTILKTAQSGTGAVDREAFSGRS